MKPILFEADETRFVSNGLGRIDAISCVVTEARNGQFELEMEVSIDDPRYPDIREGRILLVRHDDTTDKQPFDIYHISRPLNGVVTVLAQHISYRTATIVVAPFEAAGIGLTLIEIGNHAIGDNPFTFWTNKTTAGAFSLDVPKTMRSLLAGEEGSLLDVFGTGEYEWDRFNIKLHLHRGVDSGVVIRYGKDLTALEKTTDLTNVWTGVAPYWRGAIEGSSGSEITVMLENNGYVAAANEGSFPHKRIIPLDLSEEFYEIPTQAELREAAEQYVANNARTGIPTTIEFSFVNLAAYEEYENVAALQRLKLCDTVTVVYDRLGVRNTAKIIEVRYDVLQEKYISMTVGDVAADLETALTSGVYNEIDRLKKNTRGMRSAIEAKIEQVVQEQTDLIIGGTGGHVVHRFDGDGKPSEILIMNTSSVNTATQVLRINVNGIGFSSNGINGPYRSAWTLDGRFNADFISTGELNAALIKVGTLTDALGTNYWNMETGEFRLAANTKVGDRNIGVNYYGVYREGPLNHPLSVVPPTTEVPYAVGDMIYDTSVDPPVTKICETVTEGGSRWVSFSAAEGNYFVDTYTGSTYQWNGTRWDKVTDYRTVIGLAISELQSTLETQIDAKVETWAQDSNPAVDWDTDAKKAAHDGDLWLYTGTSSITVGGVTIKPQGVYQYHYANNVGTWNAYASTTENLFDLADGKATIFYGTYRTGSQNSFTPSSTDVPLAEGDMRYYSGTTYIYRSSAWAAFRDANTGDYLVDKHTGCTYKWDGSKWDKVTDYKSEIDTAISALRSTLETQIDAKVETWAQDSNPATDWDTDAKKAAHDGDLWLYTGTSSITVGGVTIKPQGVYQYHYANNVGTWGAYASTAENLFDLADGKATIFYGTYRTGSQNSFTPSSTDVPLAEGDMRYYSGTTYIYRSSAWATFNDANTGDYLVDKHTGCTYKWDGSKWDKVTDYKSEIDTAISALQSTLETQIDAKVETWAQDSNPAVDWDTEAKKAAHDGDLWLYTGTSSITVGGVTIKPQGVYQYKKIDNVWKWDAYSSTTANLFDLADGKATIFYGTYRTGSQNSFTPSSTDVALAEGDMRYYSGTTYIYRSSAWATFNDANTGDYLVDKHTGCTYKWDGSKWDKVTDYKSAITDYDTALNQTAVFNKLTNNGAIQGIYMHNGSLYINASYIATGEIADINRTNYWNLATGEFRLAGTATVGSGNKTIGDVLGDISTLRSDLSDLSDDLSGQIDAKIETWAKDSNPAVDWNTEAKKAAHDGDLWLYTGTSSITVGGVTIKPQGVYQYKKVNNVWKWDAYASTSTNLFDMMDGLATIYYGVYRSGSENSYLPTSATVALAAGDMRFNNNATYIYQSGAWASFSANTGDYFVDKYTGSTYRWDGSKWEKVTDYKSAISTLDANLNQTAIFNRLTGNGAIQGIYMQNGQLYVNATYIKSGTLSLGGAYNLNGKLIMNDANGYEIGCWDSDGLNITAGSLDIGNGNFVVTNAGVLSAKGASIKGAFETSYSPFEGDLPPDADEYKQRITFDGNGFRYHTGNTVSMRLYEDIYYELANTRIVDNGFIIEDQRSKGITLRSGKSVSIEANRVFVNNTEGQTEQVMIGVERNGVTTHYIFNFLKGLFIGMGNR